MDILETSSDIEEASSLLKAMANEKRLAILYALCKGEKNVGELEKLVNLSQSALSQHLARLRRDGIVETRRDAQVIYYSLKCDKTRDILFNLTKIIIAQTPLTADQPLAT
jgi:ArsR family transcriptional regulator, virulence genes transcriptional regulator